MKYQDSRFLARSAWLPPLVDAEWVGGRFTLPQEFAERGKPPPEVVLWLEAPGHVIVGATVLDPQVPDALAQTLARAAVVPGVGFPRRPRRVRVADAAFAAALGDVGPETELVVAPAPELDEAFAQLLAVLRGAPQDEGSYLADGAVPEEAVAALFRAAITLYRRAAWDRLAGADVLDVDIPAFGIERACLWVTGARGDTPGFVLFPTFDEREWYLDAMDAIDDGELVCDYDSPILGLSYLRRDELPKAMRRETASHGWPVAAAGAYPMVDYRNRYGIPEPIGEGDIRIVTACALALVGFLDEHGAALPHLEDTVVSGTYAGGEGIEVHLAAALPEEAEEDSDLVPQVRGGPKIGRNDPCPCGSGKKYKRCCLPLDEAARRDGPLH